MKVKEDLFVLTGGTATATALVTDDGVVLIDDKNPLDYPNLIAALKTVRKRGWKGSPRAPRTHRSCSRSRSLRPRATPVRFRDRSAG
jgi:hypothetical protein